MPNTHKIKFLFPESITNQYAKDFVKVSSSIFKYSDKQISDVFVDVSKVVKIDVLGSVLIYKFFEYTVKKKCFFRPDTNLPSNTYIKSELDRTGMKKLIEGFIKNGIPVDYNLKVDSDDRFFLVPIILDKKTPYPKKEETDNILKINSFYKSSSSKRFIILQCIAELSSNFMEHSVLDTKSILLASGNHDYFEIACADTGNGIITNLKPIIEGRSTNVCNIIQKSIEKGVTSKKGTNHMGQGLWLVDQFVTEGGGELYIISEGAYLKHRGKIVKVGESPYWKGTIIYVKLPLCNSSAYDSVMKKMNSITKNYL